MRTGLLTELLMAAALPVGFYMRYSMHSGQLRVPLCVSIKKDHGDVAEAMHVLAQLDESMCLQASSNTA